MLNFFKFVFALPKLLLTLIGILSFFNLQGQSWSNLSGPEGGTIYALHEHKGIMYAGTAGGGIYKSMDQGLSWTESSKGLSNDVFNSGNVVFCFVSDTTGVYAGTDGGVYFSSDQGATWNTRNVFFDFNDNN